MVREPASVIDERVEESVRDSVPTADPVADALVETDLLIEDVSIDGMCGVY